MPGQHQKLCFFSLGLLEGRVHGPRLVDILGLESLVDLLPLSFLLDELVLLNRVL